MRIYSGAPLNFERWTAAEDQYVRDNWHRDLADVAAEMHRSAQAIERRGYDVLMLRRPRKGRPADAWTTPERDALILREFFNIGAELLAERFGVTVQKVRNRRDVLRRHVRERAVA